MKPERRRPSNGYQQAREVARRVHTATGAEPEEIADAVSRLVWAPIVHELVELLDDIKAPATVAYIRAMEALAE